MLKKQIIAGLAVLLLATMSLVACQQATPAAPTLDANAVYTQAAQTVAAGIAQTEAAKPSPTPLPPTFTPTPTMIQPTATPELTGTPAAGTPQPSPTGAVGLTPLPTNTLAAPPAQTTGDKAEWVSQSPADGTQIKKGEKFLVKYVLKNTGTTTWTTKYTFRYYAGDKMGSPNDLNLTKEVKPKDTVEIVFELTAPDKTGKTNTIWVLTNDQGINFYSVYLSIEVVE
ncbi:NBR1-Ig-like domain-containing protein [Anaerolinea sp.]|uniref:NBR1-Ig-like domain-containing protein n=1 Tax=Anaerolinea sp. TaxID=1872519 RepID=UPI002ACDC866|nr:NBR1-Ig-like domain-containing protein [Anaerolinea sp.]